MRFSMLLLLSVLFFSCQQSPKSVEKTNRSIEKKVFFKNINDGDTVKSPFVVEMGVAKMKIHPAGELKPGTGHHHILIDEPFMKYGEIIPMDAKHLHYGKGDTVVSLKLKPGPHSLTLQFANGMHMSYGEQYSSTINIYVK